MTDKKKVLIDGHGQCKFYFGVDPNSHDLIIGIDHPESNAVIFLTGSVLATINGWLARKQPTLQPMVIN